MANGLRLKIGLIGCGSLGLQHALNVERMEAIDLVAVCSQRLASAERLAQQMGVAPKAYDDHRKMLAEQQLDAVLVVTPNNTHVEIVMDAAAAGVHVFCEKPLALSLADCDAMITAADKSRVFLMTGYLRRFDNKYICMKRMIDQGKIGDVLMGHIVLLYNRSQDNLDAWVHDRKQYGGLYSFYSHELDQLTWMAGDIVAVQAMMKYNDQNSSGVEEAITMNLEFQSGAMGSLTCCRVYPGGQSELGIAGSKGTLKITDGKLSFIPVGGEPQALGFEPNNAYFDELAYFFDCIRKKVAPKPDGRDGRRTIAIAMAAHESANVGNTISVLN